MFGDERLAKVVAAERGGSAAQVLAAVVRTVDAFRGETAVCDDLSVLVARRL